MKTNTQPERWFLYTNYQGERIYFRDIIPCQRPFASNEAECEIIDPGDLAFWRKNLAGRARETVDLLGGSRFYV